MTLSHTNAVYPSLVKLANHGGAGHFMRGRLIGGTSKHAVVVPFSHKRPEQVPWKNVHLWKSRNA